jgi:neutral trehalase
VAVDETTESLDLMVEVVRTRLDLLLAEDTDDDGQITIVDTGPKRFLLKSVDGQEAWITGTYKLGILLQELAMAHNAGKSSVRILGKIFTENPVDRLIRLIPETYWPSLTRRLDVTTINVAAPDGKVKGGEKLHIYVPVGAPEQLEYYNTLSREHPEFGLQVTPLPAPSEVAQNLRQYWDKPGILALAMEPTGADSLRGLAYTVPGYRFNEFYYWDSYFCCYGLLEAGQIETVRGIVKHMIFQIDHYGCVLNGNRAYYLQRSQPPFLSDLVMRTHAILVGNGDVTAQDFLREGISAAIKEYHHVWCCDPRLDPVTGLSRYRPQTAGIPPEVEEGHFDWFLDGMARKHGLSIKDLTKEYNSGRLKDEEMDDFFRHDLAMRESGHDTRYVFFSLQHYVFTKRKPLIRLVSQRPPRLFRRRSRHNRPERSALQIRNGHFPRNRDLLLRLFPPLSRCHASILRPSHRILRLLHHPRLLAPTRNQHPQLQPHHRLLARLQHPHPPPNAPQKHNNLLDPLGRPRLPCPSRTPRARNFTTLRKARRFSLHPPSPSSHRESVIVTTMGLSLWLGSSSNSRLGWS